ncbi:ankyrin repeat domain-containing protein [Pseudoscourfieldia marina]
MGRGGHGSHDDVDAGTPYDQSLEEMDFTRSACYLASKGRVQDLRDIIARRPSCVHSDGTAENASGYTPLHYAARAGHVECVRLLIASACNVNATTRAGGSTALHRAAFTGHIEVVSLLLDAGADASIRNTDGQTAAHDAARGGHGDVLAVLERAHAGISTLEDNRGRTAKDMLSL